MLTWDPFRGRDSEGGCEKVKRGEAEGEGVTYEVSQ